ncbi:MAG: hypothetical protein KTR32_04190 [Granulosicoccus sp.]|nr:hypothetical protein [Granulosicoccus sp.]
MSTYEISDSILKRHHQQMTGEFSGGTVGNYPITDSILRRHDAQHSLSGGSSSAQAAMAGVSTSAASAAASAGNAVSAAASNAAEAVGNAAESANTTGKSSSRMGQIILLIAALVAAYFGLKYFGGS